MITGLRIGIIGYGMMGRFYHKLLTERIGVKVASICDIDENKLQTIPSIEGLKMYKDYVKMLDEGGFDGVIITTTPNAHKDPAIEALKKGYYVMLEKPLAAKFEDALKIYETAKSSGRLMVAFTLRYRVCVL